MDKLSLFSQIYLFDVKLSILGFDFRNLSLSFDTIHYRLFDFDRIQVEIFEILAPIAFKLRIIRF